MTAAVVLPLPADVYMRTEFLERLAHELRGPAGVTAGALDEIELALGPEAEKLRDYFLMARRGVRRILRAADRLQRTAVLEAGAPNWAKVSTDLRELVAEAAKESELLEARRGVCVSVSASDEPCLVAAHPEWVRAAISEIVGNAIRYARKTVSVHTEIAGDEATVTVTDDGPGFTGPPARRFEHTPTKRGLCLSMPLVVDVVVAHGGRLEIDRASPGAVVVVALLASKRSAP